MHLSRGALEIPANDADLVVLAGDIARPREAVPWALSLGRPVVGYDHGGVGEQLAAILPEGRVPVGDRERVVERLQAWYRTPPQVPAEQPFTLERMLSATLEVYQDAAAGRDQGR